LSLLTWSSTMFKLASIVILLFWHHASPHESRDAPSVVDGDWRGDTPPSTPFV